jgi:phosphotransferase family enzyme
VVAESDPEWLTALREACELLWPPPATITLEAGEQGRPGWRPFWRWARGPARPPGGEFALVRGIRQPPLLVPAAPHAAAAAVRRYSKPQSAAAQLGISALSRLLAGGLGGVLLCGRVHVRAQTEAETIEAYLKTVMARDIRVSMYLGPPRANRKPVLQLVTDTGELAGFTKIGVNPLTQQLVRAERDALAQLGEAGLTEIVVPRVLHYGTWNGLDVLVLSSLPVWERHRPLSEAQLAAAMNELAKVRGLQRETLADSGYLRQLRSRLAATDEGADRSALTRALDALEASDGSEVLTFGAWHGDWAPWNMAKTTRGLMVWDWERFSLGVPLGFDALHHWLQTEVRGGRHAPRVVAARCIESAPHLLASFEIAAQQARLIASLYVSDLATRYLFDRQALAGAPLGDPGAWLIPALEEEVARR